MCCVPVAGVVGGGAVHADDDKHVLEVRPDVLGGEGEGAGLLEDHRDDVVPDVTLPQQLRQGDGESRREEKEKKGERISTR